MTTIRYKQLVDDFASQIRSGQRQAGTRLPTHRQLAKKHGLALATATRVYAELENMGLVSGETGRGTYVRDTTLPPGSGIDQQAVAADLVDLNFNYPSLPGQAALLRQALRRLATAGELESMLRYAPHGGRPNERAIVARHLAARQLTTDAARVLIVDGAQHGLAVTVMALLEPGDVIAVDALTYPGFKILAQTNRLELAPIAASGQGPDLDALERLCRQRRVRAIYTMPTLHNPLGWVVSERHRRRLAAIARRHDLLIIEDAAYAYMATKPPPPMAAIAPESTVYVSSFSKSVATGLRVGFVVAPLPWIAKIERAIRATTWSTPGITTGIACRWIEDGTVARLEAEKRIDAIQRQTMARDELSGMRYQSNPSSYFIWLPLPEETRADRLASTLMSEGVSVSTAEPFATSRHLPHALRLALGSVTPADLRQALKTVRRVIGEQSY